MKDKSNYTVKIKMGDAEVEVQGAESGVVKIVEALSDVLRGTRKASVVAPLMPAGSSQSVTSPIPRSSPVDIRSFFQEKKPSSDIEAAAAAAYYYQFLAPEAQRRDTIDSPTLMEAFRLARRPLPSRTIYTLTNARNAGYLDSLGEGGQFRLNPVGYNLVEHSLGSSETTDRRSPKQAKGGKKQGRKKQGRKKQGRK